MKKARFTSLQSNGPVFPESYSPKGYKLAGETLPSLAEEMLWNAARFLDSDYEKEAFYSSNKNMWLCLKPELTVKQQNLSFPTDFIPVLKKMKADNEALKEAKKLLTKDEKLAIKAEKDALKDQFGTAILDGETVPLSGYMIEAPNWIMTRGKDPRKFSWKYRVQPNEVILNIVNGKAPANWPEKNVTADDTSIWVMKYKINCGHDGMSSFRQLNKIIAFAPSVSVRQANTAGKFDKSKDILANWTHIQSEIEKGCLKGDQEALIIYLIQHTGIRIGNERDDKFQALTYGMQTLQHEHMKLTPNTVTFDFLGKDSVPENRTIEIDPAIWKQIDKLHRNSTKGNKIFNKANLNVNGYLKKIHPGATVKNLRTVVCNEVLINNLKQKKITKSNTEAEKIRGIFEANLEIAKTMNHQKNVGKNQKEGEQKIAEKVAKTKNRVKELKVRQAATLAKLNEKAAKFRKLYSNTPKLLKEKMAEIDTAKAKLVAQMEKAKLSIEKTEFALDKKKLTKDIALGTSLCNYADPNVIYSYCKSINLPVSRIFSASQMKSLSFAESVDANYWRTYPS